MLFRSVFSQNTKYNFLIKAFEAYDYYDKNGNITKTSNIPTQDGIVNINNQIADTVEPDTVSIQSDGTATYSFIGGDPELTVGTKTINVSLKVDNTVIPWGKTITGYVIGGKSTGNNFVTAGPDLISAVLRDPPGSLSYSYLEEGTTFTRESTYVGGQIGRAHV